ncbi:hypothetical protein PybrP1_011460 [[Pythium] brassicae (nom. inval.)]|nr:hypothetical protein PybrP1_011460 [[Pythium] brassicae (nom. inval.)]
MESLFVRSLALPPPAPALAPQCLASASRSTADGTFAVADAAGAIRVYAASCAALLHEFAAIHARVDALHYTSFSDALVTLESAGGETFLCVYHDWRERRRVRGYTLPLGALEHPSPPRRAADLVAVCSFTGRVVVAMGSVLNVWQCGRGFFEHVLELKVDMAQRHAFLQLEFVAIHGAYIAFASQTEVRVMEIHVRSAREGEGVTGATGGRAAAAPAASEPLSLHHHQHQQQSREHDVPEDEDDCVYIASLDDVSSFVDVPIPCASYGDAGSGDQRDEKRIFDEQDLAAAQPVVLGRDEAQQEAWNLAGLVKSHDIRVNQALSYFVGDEDVHVLMQRFLPPNHSVRALAFLPETIDNQVSVEARSYTRLLVSTEKNAFLYYFLSPEADGTRKHMSKKVFGGERHALHRTKSRGTHTPIKVGGSGSGSGRKAAATTSSSSRSQSLDSFSSVDDPDADSFDDSVASPDDTDDDETESGRVVMFYQFSSPVACIAANSSFLFVATLSDLQVWSIWSPCHYVAASRALRASLVPQPSQPQLLSTQPIPFAAAQIAALDSYVVLLPTLPTTAGAGTRADGDDDDADGDESASRRVAAPHDFIRLNSMAAVDRLPDDEFELRRLERAFPAPLTRSVLIFQQSPPSLIFSYVRNALLSGDVEAVKPSQIDLLLSLFSLYRYRADVGLDLLHLSAAAATTGPDAGTRSVGDEKERLALALETKLYDAIAKSCAADLAAIFTSAAHRNLSRAALLYVASSVASSDVMARFQAVLVGADNRAEVVDATSKYLEAFVFPSSESLPSIDGASPVGATAASAPPPGSSARFQQRDTATEQGFTRTVLLHYGKYAPEQLSRLIIDAALVWSLDDIAFGLEKLAESTSQSALVRIATLVLVLRASGFSASAWDEYTTQHAPTQHQLLSQCSFEAMTSHVQHLLTDHVDALVHVSVTHPELLVRVVDGENDAKRFTTSPFARALRDHAPLVLLQVLERVFTRAVRRQEAVLASLLFCLSVFGDAAVPSVQRMTQTHDGARASPSATPASGSGGPSFAAEQCFMLRLLVFVLETFPALEALVEKEELHEDEDELRRVKAAVAVEMTALCVQLSSFVHCKEQEKSRCTSRVFDTLLELFRRRDEQLVDGAAQLPDWVREYLETRCVPRHATEQLRALVRFLLTLSLALQHETDLVSPAEILRVYEVAAAAPTQRAKTKKKAVTPHAAIWKLENDFAALVVLLALPRVARTVDGLQLIATRADFVNLFLPYGRCYCETLEQWRFLIKTLSAIPESSPEGDEPQHDETAILANVLSHICSTLGPEDLLHVLPDDGDLALYMATIEASVRLDARGK